MFYVVWFKPSPTTVYDKIRYSEAGVMKALLWEDRRL